MCVRVIMGVVNCRLDYKLFVPLYPNVPMLQPGSSVGIVTDYGLDGSGSNLG